MLLLFIVFLIGKQMLSSHLWVVWKPLLNFRSIGRYTKNMGKLKSCHWNQSLNELNKFYEKYQSGTVQKLRKGTILEFWPPCHGIFTVFLRQNRINNLALRNFWMTPWVIIRDKCWKHPQTIGSFKKLYKIHHKYHFMLVLLKFFQQNLRNSVFFPETFQ